MHTSAYAGPAGAEFLPFALFIGAALSVTAFPVMAHILMERGELNSRMGSLGVATTGIMSVLMFTFIAFAGAVAAAKGFGDLLTKIGLQLEIITTLTFTIIVIVALVTNLMTLPLLNLFSRGQPQVNSAKVARADA